MNKVWMVVVVVGLVGLVVLLSPPRQQKQYVQVQPTDSGKATGKGMRPGLVKKVKKEPKFAFHEIVEHDRYSSKLWPEGVSYHRVWFDTGAPYHSKSPRPTVVLLHGSAFNRGVWGEATGTLKALTESGIRAVALDLPGFAHTKTPPLTKGSSRTEFLETLLAAEDPTGMAPALADVEVFKHVRVTPPYVLVAPSASAPLAVDFALAHPELVDGLVLVAPVGLKPYAKQLKAEYTGRVMFVYGTADPLFEKRVEVWDYFPRANSLVEVDILDGSHPAYLDEPAKFNAHLAAFITVPAPQPDARDKSDL
ncbi:abhydrolase domain containing 14A [Thecamonas trahens ATCC 50062]|uniref:Abhydrolase domain containing 14A n=1 Tax=Thecamonas trahens ATCC 50062 TaxID=461836 RepID=A0A0L0DPM5_THETB|nr:abhydrolase domain containing 14A [Thecamonas trahens ATCC 50062]KNC54247.1 abhydrolase domain containing 14A [Thecamonas trahens ATCC 50062]|eukprot:XP_013753882.1 abhydrolase domain containing 14A [Thecamonas trahens ATCC 50062]